MSQRGLPIAGTGSCARDSVGTGVRADQLAAVRAVGVLIVVTDPVIFLGLGAGLTGRSDLTVAAD